MPIIPRYSDIQRPVKVLSVCHVVLIMSLRPGTPPSQATAWESTLDGRVFFNTPEPLVFRDLDNKEDVYEWENGIVELISTGTSSFGSSLLSVSADGTDVYFFTRDNLVPQDRNGDLVKIYDARAGGGYFVVPAPPPCKASDECHGLGSPAPPPPDIGSTAIAGQGNSGLPNNVGKRHKSKHHHHHHHRQRAHRRD